MEYIVVNIDDDCSIACVDIKDGGGMKITLGGIDITDAKKAKVVLEKHLLPKKSVSITWYSGEAKIMLHDIWDVAKLLVDEGVALKTEKPKS